MLPLPDGHPELQFVDEEPSSFERITAVGGRHRDRDRRLPDSNVADPMLHDDRQHGPFLDRLVADLPQLDVHLFGIRLVFEMGHPGLAIGIISRRPEEESGRTRIRTADFGDEGGRIERFRANPDANSGHQHER